MARHGKEPTQWWCLVVRRWTAGAIPSGMGLRGGTGRGGGGGHARSDACCPLTLSDGLAHWLMDARRRRENTNDVRVRAVRPSLRLRCVAYAINVWIVNSPEMVGTARQHYGVRLCVYCCFLLVYAISYHWLA